MTTATKPYKTVFTEVSASDIDNSIENIIEGYYADFKDAQQRYEAPTKQDIENNTRIRLDVVNRFALKVLRNSDYGSAYYKEAEKVLLKCSDRSALLQSYEYWKRQLAYMNGVSETGD